MAGTASTPVILLQPFTTIASSGDNPSAGAGKDKVVLGGQDFYVRSVVKGQVVSEFEAGFKIGPARYDNREHAFYYVMDNFSKGFGHRRVDLDNPGYFWVSDPTNAPDVSRPGHGTLGPKSDFLTPNTPPTDMTMNVPTPSAPILDYGAGYYVVIGSAVYATTDGIVFTKVWETTTAEVAAIVQIAASDFNSAFGGAPQLQVMSTNRRSYMWKSGVPAVSPDDEGYGATDLIVYDGKLLVCLWATIYFGTLLGTDFTYNLEVDADDAPIATLPEYTSGKWIGIAEAPWGTMSPYIVSNQNVYVIDFFARKAFRVDIGLNSSSIKDAVQWAGKFYFTDGWNIQEYDPQSRVAVNVGFPRNDGIPAELRPAGGDYLIKGFIPAEDRLYAIVGGSSTPKTHLFQMKLGHPGEWSQVGEGEQATFYSHHGFQINFPDNEDDDTRYLYIVGAGAQTGDQANARLLRYWLPGSSRVPLYGRDHFAASGANLTTSWFDGGFNDLFGVALRMTIDAWHLTTTETFKVEYQLDNDEDMAWIQMVDSDNQPAVFDSNHRELYFANSSDPVLGTAWRTVRFKLTWLRGDNDTLTVELRALTFVYKKEPPPRTSWTFIVDTNRMVQEKIDVDGVDPSQASIWAKLRSLKANQTLLPFDVPSIQTGLRVEISELIIEADDIRPEESGRSTITVTVLEPVAPQGS